MAVLAEVILGTRAQPRAHPRPRHAQLLSLTPMMMSLGLRLGMSRPTFPREPGSGSPSSCGSLLALTLGLTLALTLTPAFRAAPSSFLGQQLTFLMIPASGTARLMHALHQANDSPPPALNKVPRNML